MSVCVVPYPNSNCGLLRDLWLVRLTPLWTRTAHIVPLGMVSCRFP